MVFLLTLLGSMIVCEALFCGDVRRMLATTARGLHHWDACIWTLIATNGCYGTGRDYRWE